MKQLITAILVCFSLNASAQSAEWHKLSEPVVILGDTAHYIHWKMVGYPSSNLSVYGLYTDSNVNQYLMELNVIIPDSVIEVWGTDDMIIPEWMDKHKVWMRPRNK